MKYKTLADITFPLYGITPKYKRIWDEFNVKYIETQSGTYVLDNKNLDGDTVGQRRLKINAFDKYMPRAVILTVAQLIHSKYKTFMDSTGSVFKYVKNKVVPLRYYKVLEINRIEEGCVVLLKGIDYPVKINCRDAYSINCIGLLHTELGLILYEISEKQRPDTWRKI
jgi:hypothetical protein